ncbi:HigA family addiction module antitoxin [Pseudoduganella namucuonensis]|uniref:Addiction module antidote protein, HigA family n=1 Tax=Pseudoduganella namucuonensis TaxID=1035707 RepID=A0A1I7JPJ4_9BURK|nr:HigA family addiction module antitoxin [Pseudoduganella namucuonensis]SFU87075.1 addiction module antidote protein, HigA family [Pseudoduganella namucuonensis]
MRTRLEEIHPGEILLAEFLQPLGLTISQLAQEIEVGQEVLATVVDRREAITADLAQRLGKRFKVSAQFWLNLQAEYDKRMLLGHLLP